MRIRLARGVQACESDLFWRRVEETQNKIKLAAKIAKKYLSFRVIANAIIAAANPQYHDSALNPSLHLACPPAEAMRGHGKGHRRGTALRYSANCCPWLA
jgi:hypothetical protein